MPQVAALNAQLETRPAAAAAASGQEMRQKKARKRSPKNVSDAVLSFVALSHGPHKLTRPAQRAEDGM